MIFAPAPITAEWFELEDTSRVVGQIVPHTVPVLRLRGWREPMVLWPIVRRRGVSRYPPRRHEPRPQHLEGEGEEQEEEVVQDIEEAGSGEEEAAAGAEHEDPIEDLADLADDVAGQWFPEQQAEAPGEAGAESASSARVPAAPPSTPPAQPAEPEGEFDEAAGSSARQRAKVVFHCPGGFIAYYDKKNIFEATCTNKDHGWCKLTRTNKAKNPRANDPVGGRPIGLMAAWLESGETLATKEEHWSQAVLNQSYERRLSMRNQIAAVESGRLLLSFERPLAAGETNEPLTLKGFLSSAILAE